ncbi:methyl-accepting chemotaxis protein [Anaerocolumna xylanovorans]|uniref:Methyl-accepting chemotaxis protein n=1 Tax=Anaerocolumna xylanovorans DSM 12503 TaxID=1121345 RepID=A0A1M7XXT6_9FIRM|nr:methyl-accepting chemotaxis protein [Anaerocolumna xylanovorans]SHO43760.1 methyl-accepting chemotaxis protein [Anaerocolumna xylanovorans DSM 12503]
MKKNLKHPWAMKSAFLHSIRTTLILCFLIPVVFIVALGLIIYHQSSGNLIENYEASTITSMKMMSNYLDFGFQSVNSKGNILRSNADILNYYSGSYKDDPAVEYTTYKDMKKFISMNVFAEDYCKNILMFANYGDGITISGRTSVRGLYDNFSKTVLADKLKKSNSDHIWVGYHTDLDESMNTNSTKFSISNISYLYNASKEKVGYIVVDVSNKYIQDTLMEMGFDNGSIAGFISSDNKEIHQLFSGEGLSSDSSSSKDQTRSASFDFDFHFSDQEFYKESIKGNELIGYQYITYHNQDYLFIYNKLTSCDGTLCALIPKAKIIADAQSVKSTTSFIILIASTIAILTGTLVASGISKSIRSTNKVLASASVGDLTKVIHTNRKDEFLVLSKSINHMIASMMSLIRKMTGVSNHIFQSSEDVKQNTTLLLKSSENISVSLNEINHGIQVQAHDAEHCFQQMIGLSGEIKKIYQHANEIESISFTTQEVITQGIHIMDDLGAKTNNTSHITKEVISDITELEHLSLAIGSIISTIAEIAEQTNLLSLNASIEAARAGKSGLGFAVVAEEIGKLAAHSTDSVEQINKIITQIRMQTQKTVASAKKAANILGSQEQTFGSSFQVFYEINKHVENLNNNIHQISSYIANVESSKSNTLNAIDSISSTLQQTTAMTSELGNAASIQLNAVECLNKAAEQLAEESRDLQESVRVFKVIE